jgi:hypothetical protein
MTVKNTLFRDVTPCNPMKVHRHFRGADGLYFQVKDLTKYLLNFAGSSGVISQETGKKLYNIYLHSASLPSQIETLLINATW